MERRVWLAIMRKSDEGFQVLLGLRGPNCGNPGTWGLPGGGVDSGEDLFQAVIREAEEETGLTISPKEVKYIGKSCALFGDKELHWFVHTEGYIKKKHCAVTEETVDYCWATLKDAKNLKLHYSASLFFEGLEVDLDYPAQRAPIVNVSGYFDEL